jgi:hypothetical protein
MRSSFAFTAVFSVFAGVAAWPNTVSAGYDFQTTYTTIPGVSDLIPDEGIAVFPLVISPKVDFIASLEVVVGGLSHTFPSDLDLYLLAPSGNLIQLMTDLGDGFPVTDVTLTFRDDENLGIPGSPLETGDYQPEGAFNGTDPGFSKFVGKSSGNGAWFLLAIDDAFDDTGTIDFVTLRGTVPEPTTLSFLVLAGLVALKRRRG